ncbi:hypothetical protein ISF_08082 [Cordyceps fumosorosea ARSEF 2679]|uniref:Uncharacterized protein n=1 Tax=Cordyceps fumosorosea (strain ARSEF 2679) TaxID=1081104 RepID=A0A167N5S9_CORFA|nr:hypothetical protein ISF_08082 [Cordyceps fumosorosea ARSEF 2679]OAA55161.1 hypothetical protein ISF_08082 [Cordyceps fumosorosea ARSEF 2679]
MDLNPADDVFLQDDAGLTIAQHALRCNQAFQACMAAPQITYDPTIMEDQMARFTLWAANMDVFGPPNVSFDYRLRYSPVVVEILHQLLDVILNTLVFFSQLFLLSNAVRRSAKIARADKIAGYKADEKTNNAIEELRLYTACYIRFRFPHAPEALCSVLVEANALRLRRLCYQRAHRKRVALSAQRPPPAAVVKVQLPKAVPRVPAVHFASRTPPKLGAFHGKPTPPSVPPAPTTHATTAQQTAVRAFYNGTKTEAPRAKSVAVNNK